MDKNQKQVKRERERENHEALIILMRVLIEYPNNGNSFEPNNSRNSEAEVPDNTPQRKKNTYQA